MKTRTIATLTAFTAAALLALTGCVTSADTAVATKKAAETITIESGWVKAAETGMSAVFGVLTNTGTKEITIISASTAASDAVELHETVMNDSGEMAMREKDGGFTIAAGTSLMLEPGGNHIMLMGLVNPIKAGDEITLNLTFTDGSTFEFTVPAKDFSGANENYEGGDMDSHEDMNTDGSMDMDGDK